MAEAPIMPLATDAYLADTTHLSTIEHGAYLLLLMTMWRAGGRLPNDHVKLARYARLGPKQFARIWPSLEGFFFVEGDMIGQGKQEDFLIAVRQKSNKASDSARAKWRKYKKTQHANASVEQCVEHAIQDPANQEKGEANASPKKKGSRVPDGFPDRGAIGWAISEGLPEGAAQREADRFTDYWRGVSGQRAVKADWPATWRNWCRKAIDDLPKQSSKRTAADERFARLMDFARRRDERQAADQRMADGSGPVVPPAQLRVVNERGGGNDDDGGLAGCAGRPAADGDQDGDPRHEPLADAPPAYAWGGSGAR